MNLVNDLYISSHIPLIVVIISLIVAIMTINTFRYGEILIPTIIFAILIVVNIGALYYDYHTENTLLNQPVSKNFIITKHKDYLNIERKNSNFRSAFVKIIEEDDDKYLVEYEGQLKKVDK